MESLRRGRRDRGEGDGVSDEVANEIKEPGERV